VSSLRLAEHCRVIVDNDWSGEPVAPPVHEGSETPFGSGDAESAASAEIVVEARR
jgi:hypothetical protein